MSHINEFLVESGILDSYDEPKDILTDEETDTEEACQEYVCSPPRSKTVKFAEMDRKQGAKVRQIEKLVERTSRSPGDRLGKNAKKAASRRAYIADLVLNPNDGDDEQPSISESIMVGPHKTFGRIKRKLGHRPAFFENNYN